MTGCARFPIQRAARAIARGGIVAHPTEGVYGLACDPHSRSAIERLLGIKRRDPAKGLILLASDLEQLLPFCAPLDETLRARLAARWPGPTTFIVPAARGLDPLITGGRDSVAMRVTGHALSSELCRALGHPVISTSANRQNRPPPRTAQEVRLRLGRDVDLVLAGALGGLGAPTQIRDALTDEVVRSG